ncbi:hypothetical protein FHS43_000654 [Streptosporangium becharense]|uniref:Uncharacterized protein n=1 Tax=Streptosporangium becharense TaxID=1816182 RepID=A0A7W9IFP2_9ACTN|nr:hypothetical protein [Streptosporangium becharense]MBB2909408.1 hypothetical protein [Streptosporangium becharense]MBB5819635.1 hypothetical protein [Streptosporangium becharense]
MRVSAIHKRIGKTETTEPGKTGAPLPERSTPAAPRRVPMPHLPVRPTRQPRRIPGKGGR